MWLDCWLASKDSQQYVRDGDQLATAMQPNVHTMATTCHKSRFSWADAVHAAARTLGLWASLYGWNQTDDTPHDSANGADGVADDLGSAGGLAEAKKTDGTIRLARKLLARGIRFRMRIRVVFTAIAGSWGSHCKRIEAKGPADVLALRKKETVAPFAEMADIFGVLDDANRLQFCGVVGLPPAVAAEAPCHDSMLELWQCLLQVAMLRGHTLSAATQPPWQLVRLLDTLAEATKAAKALLSSWELVLKLEQRVAEGDVAVKPLMDALWWRGNTVLRTAFGLLKRVDIAAMQSPLVAQSASSSSHVGRVSPPNASSVAATAPTSSPSASTQASAPTPLSASSSATSSSARASASSTVSSPESSTTPLPANGEPAKAARLLHGILASLFHNLGESRIVESLHKKSPPCGEALGDPYQAPRGRQGHASSHTRTSRQQRFPTARPGASQQGRRDAGQSAHPQEGSSADEGRMRAQAQEAAEGDVQGNAAICHLGQPVTQHRGQSRIGVAVAGGVGSRPCRRPRIGLGCAARPARHGDYLAIQGASPLSRHRRLGGTRLSTGKGRFSLAGGGGCFSLGTDG